MPLTKRARFAGIAVCVFANVDHLVYATAELTAMEYENGILAMEFFAPSGGEAILQLSREPLSGPFVAGGRPLPFDWDDHTLRARLQIPKGQRRGQTRSHPALQSNRPMRPRSSTARGSC